MTLNDSLLANLTEYGIRLVIAVGILVIGRYLAHKARDAAQRLIDRPEIDEALAPPVERVFRQLAYVGVLVAAIILALIVLGVSSAAIVSAVSALVILIGIALREMLANLAATLLIAINGTYHSGDEIATMGTEGTVREVGLFNTVVQTGDKRLFTLANGEILKHGVANLSRLGVRRADLEIVIGYDQDIDHAREIITVALNNDPRTLKDPPPSLVVTGLSTSGVSIQARTIVQFSDYDRYLFDMRATLKETLEGEGYRLSMPHQLVILRDERKAAATGQAVAARLSTTAS